MSIYTPEQARELASIHDDISLNGLSNTGQLLRSLADQINALTVERDALHIKLDAACNVICDIGGELREPEIIEVVALKADAARYRQLRRGQQLSVINGIGDVLSAEGLDAAIDLAMKEPK